MNYKFYSAIFILTFIPGFFPAHSQQQTATTITGFVFDDINHNNVKDKNETGIKGVAVSDQVNVVTTGEDGSYSLPNAKGYGIVFISVPDGYKSNDVLQYLLQQQLTIESFNEILPSLNEIFINLIEDSRAVTRAFQPVA